MKEKQNSFPRLYIERFITHRVGTKFHHPAGARLQRVPLLRTEKKLSGIIPDGFFKAFLV